MKQIRGDDEKRFWSKVEKRGKDECWNWNAKSKCRGYGYFSLGGRKGRHELSHRVAWTFVNGPIPDGEGHHGTVVMHTCDNRLCCNPSHLRLGSQADNVRDMLNKGRKVSNPPKGEAHHNAKITEQVARAIKRDSLPVKQCASKFGVSRYIVGRIKSGQAWAHVS